MAILFWISILYLIIFIFILIIGLFVNLKFNNRQSNIYNGGVNNDKS